MYFSHHARMGIGHGVLLIDVREQGTQKPFQTLSEYSPASLFIEHDELWVVVVYVKQFWDGVVDTFNQFILVFFDALVPILGQEHWTI